MIKKIFFLNIIILVLIILSLELLARTFNLADLMGISKNLIIFKNKQHFNSPNIEGVAFSKKVFTDELGFRIPNKKYKYNSENSSVLVLGDSVGFGVGVNEEETFVGLIRKNLKNINFYNSSVPGYHLIDYAYTIEKNKDLKKLKEILYIYVLNDISFERTIFNNTKTKEIDKRKEQSKFFNKLKENFYFKKVNYFLRNKSVLYMWIKGIISKPSKRHFYYMYPQYNDNDKITELKEAIKQVKNQAEKNNLKLFVAILPYEFQTRKENCKDDFLLPQKIVKSIFSDFEIKFKDYTSFFCDNKKPSTFFLKYDPVHLSPNGHQLVYDLLKKDLYYLAN